MSPTRTRDERDDARRDPTLWPDRGSYTKPPGYTRGKELVNRGCSFEMPDGLLCQAPAMRGKSVCYWHNPERAEDVADARRLGGLHRRKAASVATIYDFAGLRSIEGAQRLLETAALETFALENSVPRNRTLISAASGAAKLIEVGDHEERIRALEALRQTQLRSSEETDTFPDESAP
jgi:hypothetical protein